MGWTRGRVIGRGSTATVYTATASTTTSGQPFAAVKSAPLSKSNPLRSEHDLLSSIPTSPYIVSYIGHSVTTTPTPGAEPLFNLFMELAPGGTLADEIAHGLRWRGQEGRVDDGDERTVRFYTWRILKGLEHLHSHGIAHRDVKASNVLLTRTGPKIADFGCSAAEGECCARVAGTPMYMAPEAARGEEQGTAADVWSVGCTVVEMMTGKSPWAAAGCEGGGVVGVMYRIGYGEERPEVPPGYGVSKEGKDFVEKCLRRTASERWTVKELLQHPFVRGFGAKATEEPESEEEEEVELDREDKFGGIENWMSPSSVLEQQGGIWSSLEEEEEEEEGPSMAAVMSSVRSRIMGLSRCGSPCFQLPSWESDGDSWVTVRQSSNR